LEQHDYHNTSHREVLSWQSFTNLEIWCSQIKPTLSFRQTKSMKQGFDKIHFNRCSRDLSTLRWRSMDFPPSQIFWWWDPSEPSLPLRSSPFPPSSFRELGHMYKKRGRKQEDCKQFHKISIIIKTTKICL